MIRVNSQSGKGGVAYILQAEHKLDLPRRAQIEFSRVVQQHTDAEGGEMTPEAIWSAFRQEYLDRETPLRLNSVHTSAAAGEKDQLSVNVYVDGELRTLTGEGNGPIAAFVAALDEARPNGDPTTSASSTTPSTPCRQVATRSLRPTSSAWSATRCCGASASTPTSSPHPSRRSSRPSTAGRRDRWSSPRAPASGVETR